MPDQQLPHVAGGPDEHDSTLPQGISRIKFRHDRFGFWNDGPFRGFYATCDGDIREAKWVGKFGKALKFDGDGAVVILHSDDLTLGFFTITRWVKCENHGLGKPSL